MERARLLLLALWLVGTSTTAVGERKVKPHILHVIVDDFGWANTNYHRAEPTPEVVTPHMDALVKNGVMLMRHYGAQCSSSSHALCPH